MVKRIKKNEDNKNMPPVPIEPLIELYNETGISGEEIVKFLSEQLGIPGDLVLNGIRKVLQIEKDISDENKNKRNMTEKMRSGKPRIKRLNRKRRYCRWCYKTKKARNLARSRKR